MFLLSAPIYYHLLVALILLVVFVALLPAVVTNKPEEIPTALVSISYYYDDLHRRISEAQTPEALHQLRIEIELFYNRQYFGDPAVCMRKTLRNSLKVAHDRKVKDLIKIPANDQRTAH
jgi:hypothetical protein